MGRNRVFKFDWYYYQVINYLGCQLWDIENVEEQFPEILDFVDCYRVARDGYPYYSDQELCSLLLREWRS